MTAPAEPNTAELALITAVPTAENPAVTVRKLEELLAEVAVRACVCGHGKARHRKRMDLSINPPRLVDGWCEACEGDCGHYREASDADRALRADLRERQKRGDWLL